jgi:hypothetical protein
VVCFSGGFILSSVRRKLRELLTVAPSSGVANPTGRVFYELADIALADVMKLYDRDPTCKSSVDLLSASTVGMGFYTTVDEKYEKAAEAKRVIDDFCEDINLDLLLNDMAKPLIGCGNDFWVKVTPTKINDILRLPVDAVERIGLSNLDGFKIPYKVTEYKLRSTYVENASKNAGSSLEPEAVIHWRLNPSLPTGYGVGVLQVLLHVLQMGPKEEDKRPAYAWMKGKIERIMPKIFEKYAGPDVLASLEKADDKVIAKFQQAIKNRGEEGAWLFYNGKADIKPVTIDPNGRFEFYIDHILNQFYLGCETPLPRLFSTPGFTEASANAAVELQDMLIKPVQRYVKRQVEREIFAKVLIQNGLDPVKAKGRLNWGSPDTPEVTMADLIAAADKGLIRRDEFRKNAAKSGWELSEPDPKAAVPAVSGAGVGNQGNSGFEGGGAK